MEDWESGQSSQVSTEENWWSRPHCWSYASMSIECSCLVKIRALSSWNSINVAGSYLVQMYIPYIVQVMRHKSGLNANFKKTIYEAIINTVTSYYRAHHSGTQSFVVAGAGSAGVTLTRKASSPLKCLYQLACNVPRDEDTEIEYSPSTLSTTTQKATIPILHTVPPTPNTTALPFRNTIPTKKSRALSQGL